LTSQLQVRKTRVKQELTTTKKRVQEQLELMLVPKKGMQDNEIEREHIRFDKAKDNTHT
jgi:hypothetical protein